jgi:hypothetical protein
MRVPVQNNVDVVRQVVGRYVLQTEFQSAAHKIDNQGPIQIAVTISSHNSHTRPDRAQLVENALSANITQVPDFIGAFSHFDHRPRQAVMRVREHENWPHILLSMFSSRHISLISIVFATRLIVDETRLDRDARLA